MARKPLAAGKQVAALTHDEARRRNIPTAEHQSIHERLEQARPVRPVRYPRSTPLEQGREYERDPDLDPQLIWRGARIKLTEEQRRQLRETGEVEIGDAQLVWRGKDRQDWSDLVVNAPPLYIQEKVHPKALVDDLARRRKDGAADGGTPDLFADFNGLADPEARTEFYQHDQHWSNRMILGDSLQVMASLAEREGLRGKVQCIYFDPPYGIKFNSNWQVSTRSRDVKDGKQTDLSREPEQVKAFRDAWKDGVHSYLAYLRERLAVARGLLASSGSVFVQIGDENVHLIRSVLDEIFGKRNFLSIITIVKTTGAGSPSIGTDVLASVSDFVLWYCIDIEQVRYRQLYEERKLGAEGATQYNLVSSPDGLQVRSMTSDEKQNTKLIPEDWTIICHDNFTSQTGVELTRQLVNWQGQTFKPNKGVWKTNALGASRLAKSTRLLGIGSTLRYRRKFQDFANIPINNFWIRFRTSGFSDPKAYVVQTNPGIVERCVLMATDPGDLVLDPTCGSGTTATVAEQWGRRWITIDTSRVALALARTRLMSARYPYYLLADSPEGRAKEAAVSGKVQPDHATRGDLRQGFVYERAPHVTLKSIANNAQIDVIWETWQAKLEPLRAALNAALGQSWEEWQIPREADPAWDENAKRTQAAWWEARIARQREIDASIARNAEVELLYDRPYEDRSRVRVAGPFTVESLSPHRVVPADEEDLGLVEEAAAGRRRRGPADAQPTDFAQVVLEHLRTSGVHSQAKADTIRFTSLQPWPGTWIGAEGRFLEGEVERRAGILIGPEFGTLSRPDLAAAAREVGETGFDLLIACAFNFEAHAGSLTRLAGLPILQARMSPDLHMAGELKNTGKGNLFTVFGEPDIAIEPAADGAIQVRIKGVDVFDPNTGDIRSSDTDGIAAWFIDTDYDEESFFVRHAYFLGANDPYKSLKTALKAEIDEDAWATLYRAVSRPFPRPATGRIAVKVINHFGDEVMKVFGV